MFYHGNLPLNRPLQENVMFLLLTKTTFKQIQVDGRFFKHVFHGFLHPKKLRIETIQVDSRRQLFLSDGSRLVSNDFCLRPKMWQFDVAIC